MSVVPRRYVEPAAEKPAPRARSRQQSAARGAHRVLVVLALVGSVHALFVLGVEGWRFVVERQAITHLQQQVASLKTEAGGLQQVVDHANDKTYRENLARRQGFMYPNELRAVTQQPGASPAPAAPPPPAASPSKPATQTSH